MRPASASESPALRRSLRQLRRALPHVFNISVTYAEAVQPVQGRQPLAYFNTTELLVSTYIPARVAGNQEISR